MNIHDQSENSLSQIMPQNVKEQTDQNGNVVAVVIQFQQDQGKSKKLKKDETKVDFSKTKITGQQLRAVCQLLPQLRSLKLNQCQHIKNILLKGCKQLQELEIKLNEKTLTDIQLEQMPELKKLNLSNCQILQSIKLINCPQMIGIYLQKTQIGDEDLLMIAQQCPNLKKLNLSQCMKIKQFEYLSQCMKIKQFEYLSKLKKIKQLGLGWTNIMDKSLSLITKQLTQLEVLDLSKCSQIKQTIQLENCKAIKELNLWGLHQSHDNLVQLLSQQLNQLEDLGLNRWKQIQFSQLNFTNCKKLRKLHLNSTEITDGDVFRLGIQIPQLEQLSLGRCKKIVNPLLNNFNKLKVINLYQTSVSKEKIKELRQKYPNIKI